MYGEENLKFSSPYTDDFLVEYLFKSKFSYIYSYTPKYYNNFSSKDDFFFSFLNVI